MSVSSSSKALEKSTKPLGVVDEKAKNLITDFKVNGEKSLRLAGISEAKTNITQDNPIARSSAVEGRYTSYINGDDDDDDEQSKEADEDEEDCYWSQFRVSKKRNRRALHISEEEEDAQVELSASSARIAGFDDEEPEFGSLTSRESFNNREYHKRLVSHTRNASNISKPINQPSEPVKTRRLRRKRSLENSILPDTKKKGRLAMNRPSQRVDVQSPDAFNTALETPPRALKEPVERDTSRKPRGRRACKDPNKTDKSGRTKLFAYAGSGNLEALRDLIERGADVNFKDNAGWTPLHEAALKGQHETAEYIIARGADINARGFGGDTPLHDACSNGYPECVKLLVDAGADVFAVNESKHKPIDVCEDNDCRNALRGKMDELSRLVAQDKDGRTVLHRACADGEYKQVVLLLKKGANVNTTDNQSWTPLHEAAMHGHTAIVELLIAHGAVVNAHGSQGDTALHSACRVGHEDTAKVLIQAGADVYSTNDYDKNAYNVCESAAIRRILIAKMDKIRRQRATSDALDDIAASNIRKQQDDQDAQRQLSREERKIQSYMRAFEVMEQGPPKRGRPKTDETGFYGDRIGGSFPMLSRRKRKTRRRRKSYSTEAEDVGEEAVQPVHLQKKADARKLDPYKKDRCGRTQLHKWASRGDESAVELLLEAGANPSETDFAGWTPLHEACLEGHLEIVRMLLDKGADANSEGADSDTPLHDAAENSHLDVVRLLLERGAQAHAVNAKGKTPLMIAIDNEDRRIEQVIQRYLAEHEPAIGNKRRGRRLTKHKNEVPGRSTSAGMKKNQMTSEGAPPKSKTRRLVLARDLESRMARGDKSRVRSASLDIPVKMEMSTESSMEEGLDGNQESQGSFVKEESKARVFSDDKMDSHTQCTGLPSDGARTPIPTPPPENWPSGIKKERKKDGSTSEFPQPVLEEAMRYLPLYTVQLMENDEPTIFVVDLQVSLLLGMPMEIMWTNYAFLVRRLVSANQKQRLWSPMASMLYAHQAGESEKRAFLESTLHFVRLDQIVALIKTHYNHLSQCMITTTIDMGYQENDAEHSPFFSNTTPFLKSRSTGHSLPPKIAMKMKKCGLIKFSHDTTTTTQGE
ncbi:hypothetical protein DFQ28_001043 [Apophysomyces sp. BC1034]|nr:hypothetical protein DFQ30_008881 [Apophysomyces sp. BC1015]KAG0181398.1 hypothetical protein DFQ29_008455 [Apophysomyces sp. BC1021]KAG0191048.1 hypothetical protein DFQ28_001043 [Apophysomyces sp. BC1034]